ncbi:MAK10-like protein [Tanacetum coccineum]
MKTADKISTNERILAEAKILASNLSVFKDIIKEVEVYLKTYSSANMDIRTAKLRNDILMFQQHHGESLSEAWTRFKDLLQKAPHHGIDRWLQIQIFTIMSLFILSARLTAPPVANSVIRILMNLGKSLRTSLSTTMRAEMTQKNFPIPQPQALGTTVEARVRDYMAAHTEQMERFENTIFKLRVEINDRMIEMFRLLKELATNKAPEKVLIKEEAKFPVTKNVNSISLTRGEEERSEKTNVTTGDDFEKPTKTEMEMPVKEAVKEDESKNEKS